MISNREFKQTGEYGLPPFSEVAIKMDRAIFPRGSNNRMTVIKSSILFRCLLFIGLFCHLAARPSFGATPATKHLNVFTREENGVTHFYVQNLELASVTATIDMRLVNLKATTQFPCTTTLAGHETVEAFFIVAHQGRTRRGITITPTRPSSAAPSPCRMQPVFICCRTRRAIHLR